MKAKQGSLELTTEQNISSLLSKWKNSLYLSYTTKSPVVKYSLAFVFKTITITSTNSHSNAGSFVKLQVSFTLFSYSPTSPCLQHCSELTDYKNVIFVLAFCSLPSDSINGWVKPLLSTHLGNSDTIVLQQQWGKPPSNPVPSCTTGQPQNAT